jgi:hypothetical protein
MRVGSFILLTERKPLRYCITVLAHNVALALEEEKPYLSGAADLREVIAWIEAHRRPGDPPAAAVLVALWPYDKKRLEEKLDELARQALLEGDTDETPF